MPLNTVIPSDIRAAAPAPLENINGMTPKIKAIEVMTIALNRTLDASKADSTKLIPLCLHSRATSTIKMEFLQESAIIKTKPICT